MRLVCDLVFPGARGFIPFVVALFSVTGGVFFSTASRADLVVNFADSPEVVTFDATLADVNQDRFLGEGFATSPSFGQLDSDSWEVDAGSAIMPFGGSAGPPPTLFAGGDPQFPVSFPGIFAANPNGTNRALGIQPHNDHFTPGTITLRIFNNTGAAVSTWNVAYEVFAFNDTSRASSIGFSYAVGTTTPGAFTAVPALDFTSALLADNVWTSAIPRATVLPVNVGVGEQLFLRWTVDTSSEDIGAVVHDEVALDSISVTAVAAVPEPSAALFALVVVFSTAVSLACKSRIDRTMRAIQA